MVSLLVLLSLIVYPSLTSAAWAEDDAITAAEIRTLIANMDDAGHLADDCGAPKLTSKDLCLEKQAGRKRCLALREKILADTGDFVVHPVIRTDKYDQKEFDKYAGKCRGTEFNKTHANIHSYRAANWVTVESNTGLRLYVVRAFEPAKDDLLIFGRNYGTVVEPYQKREMEKAKAEGKHLAPYFGPSLFSRLYRKECQIDEIQSVPGPEPNFIDYDKVSVIRIGGNYYIADHHKYSADKAGTLATMKIENDSAHYMGGAETCLFQ